MHQDLYKQGQEVEILLCGRERERIESKITGFKAYPYKGAVEELSEAFKAPAQIKNKGMRLVLLQVGDKEVQEERFSCSGAAENHGVGHIAMMEV